MCDRLSQLDLQEDHLMAAIEKSRGNDQKSTRLYEQLTKVILEKNTIYKQQLENLKRNGNNDNNAND